MTAASRWRDRAARLLPGRRARRSRTPDLDLPWQGFVADALDAEDRYRAAVRRVAAGPLRDRLTAVGDDVAAAVGETRRIAGRGQDLSDARAQVDVGAILTELERLGPGGPGVEARRRQLETAKRIDQRLVATERTLAELDAALDEVVTRTLELGLAQDDLDLDADAHASVDPDLDPGASAIGSAVEDVLDGLQALSAGLDELPPSPR